MESSSSSRTVGGILASPRAQRRLIVFSGGVLVIGFIAFLSAFLLRGTSGIHSPLLNQPAQRAPKLVKAPPAKAALKIARQFVETAPLRKNLDMAYSLVSPALKGTMTRKQWDTGNIPVIDYPAGNAKTASFLVDWSYKTEMMLEVDLVAKKGSGSNIRPHLGFYLGLARAGDKPNGRWLVTTWVPTWHPPIPSAGPN
jgi:hypothetical protein